MSNGGQMIRTPDQRLRVFVSSTLRELAEERLAARRAIESLRLAPVMNELGAHAHPPREVYKAYVAQSDIFVGIYGSSYGWVAPGDEISGLEDEYDLASPLPKLLYIKRLDDRDARLAQLIDQMRGDETAAYLPFETVEELEKRVFDDLATLLAERFSAATRTPSTAVPDASSSIETADLGPTEEAAVDNRDATTGELFGHDVVAARQVLGQFKRVTASAIVAELQRHSPEYGSKSFGSVRVRVDAGRRRTTDGWLEAVRECYRDATAGRDGAQQISGRQVVLALAELDEAFAAQAGVATLLAELRREVDGLPSAPAGQNTEWSVDAPATVDLLGRDGLAIALAERVQRIAAQGSSTGVRESFLVHIDAQWGAGKSTLLNLLKKHLSPHLLIVEVNAWKEQRIGVPWWTLLTALQRSVWTSSSGKEKIVVALGNLFDRIRSRWVPVAASVVVLAGVIAGVLGFGFGPGGSLADSILKIISLASLAFAGLVAVVRYVVPGSKRTAQQLLESVDDPMTEVSRLFARSLARTTRDVVLFVDDLDRCEGAYVVDFLEALQTLVRTAPESRAGRSGRANLAGVFGFVAADGRWIRASYESKFSGFGSGLDVGRSIGFLFQEKVFQLHVRLPSISTAARDAYLQTLLSREGPPSPGSADSVRIAQASASVAEASTPAELQDGVRLAQRIEDPRERIRVLGRAAARYSDAVIEESLERHLLADFSAHIDPNPRSMKLVVNTYGVLHSVRAIEDVVPPAEALALWTILEARWPELAETLRRRPELIERWTQHKPMEASDARLFDGAPVRSLLSDPRWGGLHALRIRQCAGAP
jgi:hypothetical protein